MRYISRRFLTIIFCTVLALCVEAQQPSALSDAANGDYNIIELEVDSMPPLNIARVGHTVLCLDGEITVFGGHTDGFVITPTAEYFSDGAWHVVPLAYPHDHAITLKLRSGKVFLAGGHKEDLGIGQLFSAELYDPATHSSQGFGCMDKKRAFANAAEMTDGQVVISGNWFADDAVEMFENVYDPQLTNAVNIKTVSTPRATPYILRVSDNDAIIFSSLGIKADSTDYAAVDRLMGSSYREPFLEKWHPIHTIVVQRSSNHFIGDEANGVFQWLLPVENDDTRQVAIARVDGVTDQNSTPSFSLLPTSPPLPYSYQGKRIIYSSLLCDRQRKIAYLIGDDDQGRIYVVSLNYDSTQPTPLTVYVTKPQPLIAHQSSPVLTPQGDIIFAGGQMLSNFFPLKTVLRLPLADYNAQDQEAAATITPNSGQTLRWWWVIIPCLILCLALVAFIIKRRVSKAHKSIAFDSCDTLPVDDIDQDSQIDKNLPKEEFLADLFKRIEKLMEDEQLYLNANLRASDVAVRVGSNTAYVSAAINTQRKCSFSQFLAAYRIAYAQKLMRQNPDTKIATISTLSGFSTDSTFFRAFRSITGMSPKEWMSEIHP